MEVRLSVKAHIRQSVWSQARSEGLQVNQCSHLTVKRDVKESDITVQTEILSNNAVERSGNENGI